MLLLSLRKFQAVWELWARNWGWKPDIFLFFFFFLFLFSDIFLINHRITLSLYIYFSITHSKNHEITLIFWVYQPPVDLLMYNLVLGQWETWLINYNIFPINTVNHSHFLINTIFLSMIQQNYKLLHTALYKIVLKYSWIIRINYIVCRIPCALKASKKGILEQFEHTSVVSNLSFFLIMDLFLYMF